MRKAVIDIAGEVLPEASKILTDHGLKFVGTMQRGDAYIPYGMLRMVIEDEFGNLLPEQCDSGVWLVNALFTQESYGNQRLARVSAINVVGRLELAPDGVSVMRAAA